MPTGVTLRQYGTHTQDAAALKHTRARVKRKMIVYSGLPIKVGIKDPDIPLPKIKYPDIPLPPDSKVGSWKGQLGWLRGVRFQGCTNVGGGRLCFFNFAIGGKGDVRIFYFGQGDVRIFYSDLEPAP